MIAREILRASTVLVFGFLQNVGAAGIWMGEMPQRGRPGLFERQLECASGLTACGNFGCISEGSCCNAAGGWTCPGELCYTVAGTVDCYPSTESSAPTTARACYDYTATGCAGSGCFSCIYTVAPSCATTIDMNSNDIWIQCNSVGGSSVLTHNTATTGNSVIPTESPVISTDLTPRPTATSTLVPTATNTSADSSSGTTISTGAIAGIAVAAVVAVVVIGVLAFLLYRKEKNPHPQPSPQPLMNDIDNGYNYPSKPVESTETAAIELSAGAVQPQAAMPYMEPQELDSYQRK